MIENVENAPNDAKMFKAVQELKRQPYENPVVKQDGKYITNNQANLVKSILNETIDVQMIKDLNHHRAKYKSMLQRL